MLVYAILLKILYLRSKAIVYNCVITRGARHRDVFGYLMKNSSILHP